MNTPNASLVTVSPVTQDFAVSPQLSASQMSQLAAMGFRSVVNNRPDGEGGPEQPSAEALRKAALAAGLEYRHVPVPPSQAEPEQVLQMQAMLTQLPLPVLAFCRSGTRSRRLYEAVQALGDPGF